MDCHVAVDVGNKYVQTMSASTNRAYVDERGRRMEDAHAVLRQGKTLHVLVADGHGSTEVTRGSFVGGRESAEAAVEEASRAMRTKEEADYEVFAKAADAVSRLAFGTRTRMVDGCVQVETHGSSWQTSIHGSTLTVATLRGKKMSSVLHVGDSVAVCVDSSGAASKVGREHTVRNEAERERMRRGGARVRKRYFQCRMGKEQYDCQLSRSLGHVGDDLVLDVPEKASLPHDWRFLLVGTDGVWDHVSVEEVQRACEAASDAKEAASRVMETVLRNAKHSTRDNATLVVVRRRSLTGSSRWFRRRISAVRHFKWRTGGSPT